MLWSLISSAFVIYLYRKLKAEQGPEAVDTDTGSTGAINVEINRINQQISSLEAKIAAVKAQETPS